MKKAINIFGLCVTLSIVSCKQQEKPKEISKEPEEAFAPGIRQQAWYANDTFHLATYYQEYESAFINNAGVMITTGYAFAFYNYKFPYKNEIKGDFDFIKNSKDIELGKAKDFMDLKKSIDEKIDSQLKVLNAD